MVMLPVPFKVVSAFYDSYTESDYETAIDISHTYGESSELEIELMQGGRLMFRESATSTSYSYLEPDFDLMEETGEVVYGEHPSEAEERYSQNSYLWLQLPASRPVLSEEDILAQMEVGYCEAYQDYLDEPYVGLFASQEAAMGFTAEVQEEIKQVLSAFAWKQGNQYKINFSEAAVQAFRALDAQAQAIRLKNLQISIEEAALRAKLELRALAVAE